ncbi:hypothetical protein OIU76_024040 [Salix suchowensis]|nr:hypothetical protein OIU76_024040 [Salix suchowensis]
MENLQVHVLQNQTARPNASNAGPDSSLQSQNKGLNTQQEQNIENENMGGDIGRVLREVQVVEARVEDERISSHAVAGNDVVSITGMRAQEHRVSEGALEIRPGTEPVDRALEQSTAVFGN